MIFAVLSAHTPQPLIWLARSEISSAVVAGRPERWTTLLIDCRASIAPSSTNAGCPRRASGIMVSMELFSLPVTPAVVGGSTR